MVWSCSHDFLIALPYIEQRLSIILPKAGDLVP